MSLRDIFRDEIWRLRLLFLAMFCAFGMLLWSLWQVQVVRGAQYERGLERQSVRRVRLPGLRGRMFDAHGRCVADNRASYNLVLYLEELRRPGHWSNTVRHVEQLIEELSRRLQRPPEIGRKEIWNHIRYRLPLPLTLWQNLDERTIARAAELTADVPALEIRADPIREYPFGSAACHVIGFCGRADPPADEEPYHFYIPELAGRAGLEQKFDALLRGRPGGELLLVDASGCRFRELGRQKPEPGGDLLLSLDMRIQQVLDQALAGHKGAGVIVDPRTGDILAMSSVPGFDPNDFQPTLRPELWRQLTADAAHPLVNRAISGQYAPGSTFKPIVALAALAAKRVSPQQVFHCPGYFTLGNTRFGCWYPAGHGAVDLHRAIEQSCNVYFFEVGLLCGLENIRSMALSLGLGRPTGIELDGEAAGLVPSEAWKRQARREGWRDGDTVNLSIGQGFIAVTPLQMALVAAAIANGGVWRPPRLIRGIRPTGNEDFEKRPLPEAQRIPVPVSEVERVRLAMRDVIMSRNGTGRLAQVPGVTAAGKTGTAEYGPKGSGLKYGWMIAFAPFEEPRYAIALVVEEAETGGRTTAPIMREVLRGLFESPGAGQG